MLAGRFRTRPGLRLTRRRSEDALLLVAVGLGVYKLGTEWHEKAIAGGESAFAAEYLSAYRLAECQKYRY